ncbi:hypothetical protein PCE1_001245 [Barthelona sp. PCE]
MRYIALGLLIAFSTVLGRVTMQAHSFNDLRIIPFLLSQNVTKFKIDFFYARKTFLLTHDAPLWRQNLFHYKDLLLFLSNLEYRPILEFQICVKTYPWVNLCQDTVGLQRLSDTMKEVKVFEANYPNYHFTLDGAATSRCQGFILQHLIHIPSVYIPMKHGNPKNLSFSHTALRYWRLWNRKGIKHHRSFESREYDGSNLFKTLNFGQKGFLYYLNDSTIQKLYSQFKTAYLFEPDDCSTQQIVVKKMERLNQSYTISSNFSPTTFDTCNNVIPPMGHITRCRLRIGNSTYEIDKMAIIRNMATGRGRKLLHGDVLGCTYDNGGIQIHVLNANRYHHQAANALNVYPCNQRSGKTKNHYVILDTYPRVLQELHSKRKVRITPCTYLQYDIFYIEMGFIH